MMKIKIIIPILLFVIVAVVIILYITLGDSNIFSPTEINFRITWELHSARGVAIGKIVDAYNGSQKKVHVNLVGGNEVFTDFISELEKDETDVYMVPYRYVRDTQISGEFIELGDIYELYDELYYETVKQMAKSNGKIVSVPWIGHSMALIYNKDIVEKAGVDPQQFTSLDDLLDACKTINDNTGKKGLGLIGAESHDITWMMSQFIYTFGGCLAGCDTDGIQTEVMINSEQSYNAIDFYINELGAYAQDGWQEHTGEDVMDAFRVGEIAFEIQGPWGITDIWKSNAGFETGAISLAQMGMYSEVGPLMLSISKDSGDVEGAKDFVSYLLKKSTLERVMDGEYDDKYETYYPYRVPLRTDMESSAFFTRYPEFLVFIEGYEMPSINTPSSEWVSIYKNIYAYYMHIAATGEIDISEALQNIENRKPID